MPDSADRFGYSRASLFEALPQGVLVADAHGRYIDANPAASRILGMEREALLASGLPEPKSNLLARDGSRLSPEDAPGVVALRTGRAIWHQVLGMVREDGDTLWLDLSATPLPEGGVLVSFEDITRHHLAETILAARTRIAELAATASLEAILRATLDEAELLTGSTIGFFHVMDDDGKALTLKAWSTRTEQEFCQALGRGTHHPVDQAGVWADAVRQKRPVIHNDYQSLPDRKGMPEGHALVHRELLVPVLRGGQVMALLGVGNKPFPYGNRDLQTMMTLADLAWDVAERKHTEQALAVSEAQYRSQFEGMTQGAFVQHVDGTLLDVNPAALELFGLSRGEFLGRTSATPAWDVIREDGSPFPGEEHPSMQALRTGQRVSGQVAGILNPASGRRVWVEINAIPECHPGESLPHRVQVTLHDITARRDRAEDLRAAQSLLGSVLDSLQAHVAILDASGNILAVNEPWRVFARENGISETHGHVEDVNYLDAMKGACQGTAREAEGIRLGLLAVLQGTLPSFSAEYPCDSPTEPRWFRMNVLPLRTEQGGAVVTHENITAERAAREAQATSELRYRSMLRTAMDGVWLVSSEGRLLEVNEAACQMLGQPREHLLTMGVMDVEALETPDDVRARIDEMRQKGSLVFQSVHRRADGTTFPVEVSTTFLPDTQQIVVYARDITEKRAADEALRASESRLRAIVENSRDAIGVSIGGIHVMVNPAYRSMFGLEPEEDVRGLPILDLIAPEDRQMIVQYGRERAARGTLPSDYEVNALRRDGSTFRMEVHASTYDLGGEVFTLVILRDITERNQKEISLRESEARFRAMFEDSPIGVWEEDFSAVKASLDALRTNGVTDFRAYLAEHPEEVLRLAGEVRILRINRASLLCLKAESEVDLVRNLPNYFTPASVEVFKEALLALMEGRTFYRTESPHLDAHGNLLDFDISFTLEAGQEVSLSRVLVSFVDITERKAIESALRASELQMRQTLLFNERLLATMPIGALVFRADTGQCLLANEAMAQAVGGTREILLQQCFRDISSWRETGMVEVAERVLATGRDEHLEVHVTSTFGRECWLSCDFSSFISTGGQNLLILCTDISERKRAELTLARSERQYHGLFDSMEEGFALHEILTDEDGNAVDYRFLEVNPAFEAMTGLPKDRWIGRTVREVVPGIEPKWIHEYGLVALTGQSVTFEEESRDLGRWYRVTAYRPAPRQFAVLITDISARKVAEAEREQLEHQLARGQKMESLGSLAGGVAHDMNNVLGAIMGLASIHQEQAPDGSRLQKSMDTILKACTRGRTLVKGLLGFARQGLEEVRVLDLNEVVREEVALLERTIPANVTLGLDLGGGLWPIHGDAASLSHVLMNLCVNAIDAMPAGGELRLRSWNQDTGMVCLEVADTGCGMSPEVLEKALDPFFTTKPQGKGTGLGLAIAYGTVKAHHGRLEIASTPGQGTRVLMQFPASSAGPEPKRAPAQGHQATRTLDILVVDDDELIQHSLTELLGTMGHRPVITGSGEEALRLLDLGLVVDVVLLDLNMPGLGGAGTLPLLRALRPELPVIIATGKADQTAMDLVARTSKTTLLPKPFSGEEIMKQFRQMGLA